ncbi:MAG: 3-isopropylmalate dehydrogenase [Atopobiaceae bacterium]|nr:3-isopropylmalate dehydrogenase [Atopobiaceae bacterium]
MKTYTICTLPGDGIGPEIMQEGKKVLSAVEEAGDVSFVCNDALLGGCAIDAARNAGEVLTAFPEKTRTAAQAADAVLLAAVGGPKWDTTDPQAARPEQGLLGIRKALGLYVNLRPVHAFKALAEASTLKPDHMKDVDFLIVRELTGGLYFGKRVTDPARAGAGVDGSIGRYASDACEYSEYEIERVIRWAYEAANRRPRHRLVSVDKANVLATSRLWRSIAHEMAAEYPRVKSTDMLVDNCAMQLIANPSQFDVLVTENTFGDILSDEAAQLTGSLGMLASASIGTGTPLFEPSHGSAPDIAGRGVANPLAQIGSVALMLRYAFGMTHEAAAIEASVEDVLDAGWRTADIADASTAQDQVIGTSKMGDEVVAALRHHLA